MAGIKERYALWRTRRWVTTIDVRPSVPLDEVHLRAVMVTWCEEDIVATTVENLLQQGCEEVHVLDNGSGDETTAVAAAAGATVEDVFTSSTYDARDGAARANALVDRVSRATGYDHVWWLYVDADELVEGPNGRTLRTMLDGLDRSHRVVGSRTVNHYPRRDHPFVAGEDPRRTPTNAQERRGAACASRHWKHPLVRWDAEGPDLRAGAGYHVVETDRRLAEPRTAIISHHYQYRNLAVTAARLERLRPRLEGHEWAMARREANLEAIYHEAYGRVDPFDMVGPGQQLRPRYHPAVRPA